MLTAATSNLQAPTNQSKMAHAHQLLAITATTHLFRKEELTLHGDHRLVFKGQEWAAFQTGGLSSSNSREICCSRILISSSRVVSAREEGVGCLRRIWARCLVAGILWERCDLPTRCWTLLSLYPFGAPWISHQVTSLAYLLLTFNLLNITVYVL